MSPGQRGMIACTLEATAHKPGNVHPEASFSDLCYADFLAAAAAIRPVLDEASGRGVGRTVLACVRESRRLASTNVNLGICLLLAPLAALPSDESVDAGIDGVLRQLTTDDARFVYEAIRLTRPGGMGRVHEQDISGEPTEDLGRVMQRAADHDLVARQYSNNFEQVRWGAKLLSGPPAERLDWEQAVIYCQLNLMAFFPDTLIARKRGGAEAIESARRAQQILAAEWPATPESRRLLVDFDGWLRAVGHQRNPGTTADLVTASLFVALRNDTIQSS